eukprot:30889-Pelagococcus_subviridis.AAC.2
MCASSLARRFSSSPPLLASFAFHGDSLKSSATSGPSAPARFFSFAEAAAKSRSARKSPASASPPPTLTPASPRTVASHAFARGVSDGSSTQPTAAATSATIFSCAPSSALVNASDALRAARGGPSVTLASGPFTEDRIASAAACAAREVASDSRIVFSCSSASFATASTGDESGGGSSTSTTAGRAATAGAAATTSARACASFFSAAICAFASASFSARIASSSAFFAAATGSDASASAASSVARRSTLRSLAESECIGGCALAQAGAATTMGAAATGCRVGSSIEPSTPGGASIATEYRFSRRVAHAVGFASPFAASAARSDAIFAVAGSVPRTATTSNVSPTRRPSRRASSSHASYSSARTIDGVFTGFAPGPNIERPVERNRSTSSGGRSMSMSMFLSDETPPLPRPSTRATASVCWLAGSSYVTYRCATSSRMSSSIASSSVARNAWTSVARVGARETTMDCSARARRHLSSSTRLDARTTDIVFSPPSSFAAARTSTPYPARTDSALTLLALGDASACGGLRARFSHRERAYLSAASTCFSRSARRSRSSTLRILNDGGIARVAAAALEATQAAAFIV